jgi:DNA repair exonuclease SbcCD ATPase subunit
MIHFKAIRWKNLLSTGNIFTEIKLNRSPNTLIVGENGGGKSTLLDALCFGLFGKPFRNINKPQLLNSINKKNLLVEVEFSVGGKDYKIVRGIKPNIFEIHSGSEVINQDAAARDYQKYLEESVLKLNYKSFTQIVILGSASFTPFMQLPPGTRREIIEDILDIQIFTTMNTVLRDKMTALKDEVTEAENKLEVLKQKATIQKEYVDTLEANREKRVDEILGRIAAGEEKISSLTNLTRNLEGQKETEEDARNTLGDLTSKQKKLEQFKTKFSTQLRELQKEVAFYNETDECPTCRQGIAHDHKETIVSSRQEKIDELSSGMEKLQEEFTKLEELVAQDDALVAKINELTKEILTHNNEIIVQQRIVQALNLELNDIQTKTADIDVEKDKLKQLAKEVVSQNTEKARLNEEKHYMEVVSTLLKDTGIKTKIIRQYLPVINKLVNKYLQAMDFFVQFNLDEKFDETIKSRHRDDFSYASFSEGEKQGIDLALLFTWRTIAKMKNSVATNLLILDEVFDSSLDNNGTDYVMSLLDTIGEDTNVFVISHKGDQLFDKFRSLIKFEKKNNYSEMVV